MKTNNSGLKIALIALSVWIVNGSLFAQEIVTEVATKMQYSAAKPPEAFPIALDNGELFLILLDRTIITCNQFDDSFGLKWQATSDRPDNVVHDLMGYYWKKNILQLIFLDRGLQKKNISVVEVDTVNQTLRSVGLAVPWGNQYFVQSVSYMDKFYTLTVEPNSSILHLFELTDEGNFSESVFDFADHLFSSTRANRISQVIVGNEFILVDNTIPNSVETSSHTHKLYCQEGKLFLSFDASRYRTTLITIDLLTKEATKKTYEYNNSVCDNQEHQSSNSFLFKELLFQTKVCGDGVFVTISDLSENKVLKNFDAKHNDTITWSNTPIMQKGSLTGINISGEQRELSKTQQFTRKAARLKAGISVFANEDLLEMTVGAFEAFYHPGTSLITSAGGMISAGTAYTGYYLDKSVQFKSLLKKETLDHESVAIRPNVFDTIRNKTVKEDSQISATSFFRIGETFYLGHYYKDEELYRIRKF